MTLFLEYYYHTGEFFRFHFYPGLMEPQRTHEVEDFFFPSNNFHTPIVSFCYLNLSFFKYLSSVGKGRGRKVHLVPCIYEKIVDELFGRIVDDVVNYFYR